MDMDDWVGAGLDVPMFIVTTAANGEKAGCLVGFATQCSIDPLRFVVFLSKKNRTYRVAQESAALGIHVVPPDRMDLAELFGAKTGDDVDKFERITWREEHGVPVLDVPAWFVGTVVERFDAGDHEGFVVDPIAGATTEPVPALGFLVARSLDPGHEA